MAFWGIYEIAGNQLRICLRSNQFALKIDQRPKSFGIEPDSRDILLVLERYQPPDDEKAIEGNWVVISQTESGKSVSGAESPRRCEFQDHWFRVVELFPNEKIVKVQHLGGLYTMDASKQPKTITIYKHKLQSDEHANYRDQELLGIYKFDGDRLTIAYRQGEPRPEKFESPPGSGVTLLVLERPKPAASPKPDEPKAGESQAPPNTTKPP